MASRPQTTRAKVSLLLFVAIAVLMGADRPGWAEAGHDVDEVAKNDVVDGTGVDAIVDTTKASRSGPSNSADPDDLGEMAIVKITDMLHFEPDTVEIKQGTTVEWKSVSVLVHTVTADPALATVEGSVELPANAAAFNSGNIEPEASFHHRFDVPGTYRYFCIPHEAVRMRGTVIVK